MCRTPVRIHFEPALRLPRIGRADLEALGASNTYGSPVAVPRTALLTMKVGNGQSKDSSGSPNYLLKDSSVPDIDD
jgi:hypothetical protein